MTTITIQTQLTDMTEYVDLEHEVVLQDHYRTLDGMIGDYRYFQQQPGFEGHVPLTRTHIRKQIATIRQLRRFLGWEK